MNLSEALANKIIEKLKFKVRDVSWNSFELFRESIKVQLDDDGDIFVSRDKKTEGFEINMSIDIGNFKKEMDYGYSENDSFIINLLSNIERAIQVIKEC